MAKINLSVDKSSPFVVINYALKIGSIYDPKLKEGLASLTLSMLLRGTNKYSYNHFHEELDLLGAEIYMAKSMESLRIYGVVLKENLAKFLVLFREMLKNPAFNPEEFAKLKQQTHGVLQDELSSDDDIADRRFQEYLLSGHEYGRITHGSLDSISNITIDDVRDFYKTYFVRSIVVVGVCGNINRTDMRSEVEKLIACLPDRKMATKREVEEPEIANRDLYILDKDDRSQSQIILGSKGIAYYNKDYHSLSVANHVFGGSSFSAWLMSEIREKRGWSYGAYAFFRSAKRPLYFAMQTVPSNDDTVPAVQLMLKLFDRFRKKGIKKEEFQFAKTSLVNQTAFMQDTYRKQMENKVIEELLGLPKNYYADYLKLLKNTSYTRTQKAIHRHFEEAPISGLILCSKDKISTHLEKLHGFNLREHAYDEQPQ